MNIPKAERLKKENLIMKIRQTEAEREGLEVRGGILEIMSEGVGFFARITRSDLMMFMYHRLNCVATTCALAIWSSDMSARPANQRNIGGY